MNFKGCLYDRVSNEIRVECQAWTERECSNVLDAARCNVPICGDCIVFTAAKWKYNMLKYTGNLLKTCQKKVKQLEKEYYESEESDSNFRQDLENRSREKLQTPPV